ncbi:MAG: hypothetical protein WAU86_05215, partial [Oricola sp.]
DIIADDSPTYRTQHLFTAMSRDVVAFAFISRGMTGMYVNLLLKRYGADSGCLYSWPDWGLFGFRVRAMQGELEDNRPESRKWSAHQQDGLWGIHC